MGAVTPVTILTGRLASGKSSLVNRLVAAPGFADTAVIVNEIGEVAVGHALARVVLGGTIFQPGGCLCCRATGEVVAALRELHFQRAARSIPAFSRALIETAGFADPAHLVAALADLPLVAARYALAGIVATVDARRGPEGFDSDARALHQVAMADRVVITHADRSTIAALDALEARLVAINPRARVLRAARGELDPRAFFAFPVLDHADVDPTLDPTLPRKPCNPPPTETSSPSPS